MAVAMLLINLELEISYVKKNKKDVDEEENNLFSNNESKVLLLSKKDKSAFLHRVHYQNCLYTFLLLVSLSVLSGKCVYLIYLSTNHSFFEDNYYA